MIEARSRETIVRQRYAAGAKKRAEKLCCPVDYQSEYLKVIPREVIERDYGCGDPSRYLREGETVLDLGSGTGKICFIAAQIVGPKGKVIGVDMTDEMLEVARRNAPIVAERIGCANVQFRKGHIQDLALDLELLDRQLKEHPITNAASFLAADDLAEELRCKHPLVASDSIDVVVSNCVLNLVEPKSKRQLFDEIFRVLKKGGRAVISDIVSDEEVPEEMQNDPELWSGCISGALMEEGFLGAFESAGFYGIQILKRDVDSWRTVQGIEFRSVTVEAFKGKQGECFERNQAVIYRGPFKEVLDDDNHRMERPALRCLRQDLQSLPQSAVPRLLRLRRPDCRCFTERSDAVRLLAHFVAAPKRNEGPGLQRNHGSKQQVLRWRELLLTPKTFANR